MEKRKYEIVFEKRQKEEDMEEINTAIQVVFGHDTEIDWRDEITVEITTTEVMVVEKLV